MRGTRRHRRNVQQRVCFRGYAPLYTDFVRQPTKLFYPADLETVVLPALMFLLKISFGKKWQSNKLSKEPFHVVQVPVQLEALSPAVVKRTTNLDLFRHREAFV